MAKAKAGMADSSTTGTPIVTGHEQGLAAAKALPKEELLPRLRINNHKAPDFIATEVLLTLCRETRSSKEPGDKAKFVELSSVLAARLLKYSTSYIRRKMHWKSEAEQKDLTMELALYVWEFLFDKEKARNVAFAERRFGRYFKCRAIDFSRSLKPEEEDEEKTESLVQEDSDGDAIDDDQQVPEALKDYDGDPVNMLEGQESNEELNRRKAALHKAIAKCLTEKEQMAVLLHHQLDLPIESVDSSVETVAKVMNKTPRMIRIYLARASEKLKKEMTK